MTLPVSIFGTITTLALPATLPDIPFVSAFSISIALSKATKVVHALLTAGKEYVGIMHLHKDADEKRIKDTCKSFVGEIRQLPPLKSAVKRRERTRKIYYFDILEKDDKDVLFIVGCEAGTYIRKLIHDLGQRLKVGAHMLELRRTKAGPFNEDNLFSILYSQSLCNQSLCK